MNSVLFYQIEEHVSYLSKFVTLFRSFNKDTTGIISEENFRFLVRKMKILSVNEEAAP